MPVSKIVTVRSLAVVALAAGALAGAVTLPASAADGRPHRANVEISGVQYNAPGRYDDSARSLNKEWAEVTNNSRHGVNLDGWTLADEDGHTYTFHHYRLDGGATVRVRTGEGRDRGSNLFQDRRHEFLDNDSDTVTLRNDHGRFVDDFSWGDHHHRGGDHRGGDHRGGEHRGDHHGGRR
ncbi:lamin tail domain-containing protein [Streptomyces sp. SAS_270]|uniref:lamin tail domain-containing protein n=1 Tax=Streptomyces sp. SAS_270 TaxID=3412748 RepID=UPI00403C1045